jgi:probable phosphomutase (TIGR03848 family)
MTTIFLIRHAETDVIGRVMTGWLPGVHLNPVGVTQAGKLAARIARAGISAIYSSPLERAMETAQAVADRLGLEITSCQALGEVRMGEWEGRAFEELDKLPEWRLFNSFRSSTRPPGGELMLEVQARVVSAVTELLGRHPGQTIALVSHADVIRAAVAHYTGIPLDLFQRFEISPASLTILRVSPENATLLRLNDTGDLE